MSEDFFLDPTQWGVELAGSGPKEWQRIESGDAPPQTALEPVNVSNITTDDDRISFDVDQVGVPVLVKVSYFPNWQASGAEGPWRVAPNLMVVIPTSEHVSLHYGRTPIDLIAIFLTLLGIAGVVWLARTPPLAFPAPKTRPESEDVPDDAHSSPPLSSGTRGRSGTASVMTRGTASHGTTKTPRRTGDHTRPRHDLQGLRHPGHRPRPARRRRSSRAIGAAFAGFADERRRVLIAHDMRPIGPELAAAFTEGVRREGVDVVDLGLASTDLIYFAAGPARRAGRDVHRVAQPCRVQRHQAVPRRGAARRVEDTGLGRDQGDDGRGLLADGDARPARGTERSRPARRLRRTTCTRSSTSTRCGR